jgi:BirA family biotin operon repressor/biotin-[acetyl-CoA-carboxylase] ligase
LLKWPNDILLAERKLAGVLLENVESGDENRSLVVIGTGINLASHPDDLPQPAISLAALGVTVSPGDALGALADTTHEWLKRWDEGYGFANIRRAWLDRAGPTGRPLRVKVGGAEMEGSYAGLDTNGALRFLADDGAEHRIVAGDVYFSRP